jgi:hypothetical protein
MKIIEGENFSAADSPEAAATAVVCARRVDFATILG